MPKLPQNIQEKAEQAESKDFSAFPAGTYEVQLTKIDTTKVGKSSKVPYWELELTVTDAAPAESRARGRKVWDNMSLGEDSAWKVKQVFDAFGYELSSDSDEMVGELCLAEIGTEIQAQGAKAGQVVNVVNKLMPVGGAMATSGAAVGVGASAAPDAGADPWS